VVERLAGGGEDIGDDRGPPLTGTCDGRRRERAQRPDNGRLRADPIRVELVRAGEAMRVAWAAMGCIKAVR